MGMYIRSELDDILDYVYKLNLLWTEHIIQEKLLESKNEINTLSNFVLIEKIK